MNKNKSLNSMYIGYVLILLLVSTTLIDSQTIVETLPGYPGPLPFKLETGYIGVGEDEAVQLFYYFVESEGTPEKDPLIVWLAGGPGCSSLRSFFFEIGPLQIDYGRYVDDVPALQVDPYSWTKVASIIYLDAPATIGYSYTENSEAAHSSDTISGSQTAEFIRKFVGNHPKLIKNPFYVAGISYQGIVIPMITEEIYKVVLGALVSSHYLYVVSRKIGLVYAGGSVGLMGMISLRGYLMEAAMFLGIIPKALVPLEMNSLTSLLKVCNRTGS